MKREEWLEKKLSSLNEHDLNRLATIIINKGEQKKQDDEKSLKKAYRKLRRERKRIKKMNRKRNRSILVDKIIHDVMDSTNEII